MAQNHRWLKIQRVVKRGMDFTLALAGLILLCPFYLLIALIIKLDSPGKAIYRHRRIGKQGIPFDMYKFRTMASDNNDAGYMQYLNTLIESEINGKDSALPYRKLEGDPRVTKVGKALRCFYLDELPQLANVLKGDMSLVGPRPHVQFEVDHYKPEQLRRLSVRPGMTGLWQIEGKAECSFSELIEVDLSYIDRWSLWSDIRILGLTFYSLILGGEKFIMERRQKKPVEKPVVINETDKLKNWLRW